MDTPGGRIASARTKAGLSPAALAAKIGTTEGAIRQLEVGGPENYPKLPNALKIGVILGIDPWEIAFGQKASLERKRLGAEPGPAFSPVVSRLPLALEQWMERAEQQLQANRALAKALEKKVSALERTSPKRGVGTRKPQ